MKELLLFDSSFFIRILRSRGDPFGFLLQHQERYDFATCGAVMTEVLQGIRSSKALEDLELKFDQMIYLPTDKTTWQLIRKTSTRLLRAGMPTAMPDLIIAGCAMAADATVFTYDSDFDRISNLKVIHSFA